MTSETAQKTKNLLIAAGLMAMFTWGVLAYIEFGKWAAKGTLFARVLDGKPYVNDFVSYYNAATLGRRCLSEKIDIYSIELQNESLNKLVEPVVPTAPFYLQYPPYFFALVTPLAYIGMLPAWLLWNISGLTLLCLTTTALCQKEFVNAKKRLVVLGMILCSYPCWLSTEFAQASLFVYSATGALFKWLEERRSLSAGLVSGMHMIKFQYYPVIGLIGLMAGKAKFFAGACIIFAALMLIASLVVGWDNIVHYPEALLKGESGGAVSGVAPQAMQNIRGEMFAIMLHLVPPEQMTDNPMVKYCTAGGAVLGVLAIAWLWLVRAKQFSTVDSNWFRVVAAASILIMLTTSLHTHNQDYLMIGLVAIMLLPWLDARIAEQTKPGLKIARTMLIWWAPTSWFFFFFTATGLPLIICFQPFFFWALTLLFITLTEVKCVIAQKGKTAG